MDGERPTHTRIAYSNEEQVMAGSSHGHTPAAWTGVIIVFIGFCVAGAFMVMNNPLGFWAGMVIALLGGVVGAVMRSMGLGQPTTAHPVRQVAKAEATREPVNAES
jgi:ABC-type iron transport system FetAB permease component